MLMDITALMNLPQRDEELVREAGVVLDRALFPLLVGIERHGPVGIVALAEGISRDYTTVSRQVAKLESLGLVERRQNPADRRINEAEVTARGRAMTARIDDARARIVRNILGDWSGDEIDSLLHLMRRLSTAMRSYRRECIPEK